MFARLGRHFRPLTARGVCSSRDRVIPIRPPRRSAWDDFPRFTDLPIRQWGNYFNDVFRRLETGMQPRFFDAYYVRPRDLYQGETKSEVAQVKYNGTTFEVKLDVQHYAEGELTVKLAGNRLTVSGKYEQKADEHGFVSREFHREFTVPEDVNLETLTSSISDEGILTVKADIKGVEKQAEKVIEIQKEAKTPEKD